MRLLTVRIEGYRSVKRPLELRLDDRVTALLGPNDHGKTNILLAISHLKPDVAIRADDRNWDLPATGHPRITYRLAVNDADRRRIIQLWAAAHPSAAPSDRPKAASVAAEISLVRHGEGQPLTFADPAPPEPLAAHVLATLPVVELFEPTSTIPDSASQSEIAEPSHEFMQGIFLYAGIKRDEWPVLFEQTDTTLKRLEDASRQLNRTLRRDWTQGQELQFELRHDSATERVVLRLKDPAVRSRWVRASQRSSGFTHYFALRTRMYARTGGYRHGRYLWLFDEPGVWLHPAAQFDLMQALEALAASSQIVYSTHSVFLLNRNFPARHRLIVKSDKGTTLDSKPFVSRWSAAIDALGFSISGTLLFAPCVVLAEGDSDPVLIYPTLQKLAEAGLWDRDINSLSVMATGDLRNAEAIARLLLQGAHKPRIAILVDGDAGGLARARGLKALADQNDVKLIVLSGGTETEDFIPDPAAYVRATAEVAADISGGDRQTMTAQLEKAYEQRLRSGPLVGLGRWAAEEARSAAGLEDAPSKVVVARAWAAAISAVEAVDLDLEPALTLARQIDEAVSLPPRATEAKLV